LQQSAGARGRWASGRRRWRLPPGVAGCLGAAAQLTNLVAAIEPRDALGRSVEGRFNELAVVTYVTLLVPRCAETRALHAAPNVSDRRRPGEH
jgi:hypothetical protein